MATYVVYMRPRIRRDLLSHDFPLWRSSGPSVAVPINSATGTLSHDPFHHIADLGASHGRSLFSELSLDVPGTGNWHLADEPTCDPTDHSHVEERSTAPVGLPAGKYRCPSPSSQRPKTASSAIASASEARDKSARQKGFIKEGRKERRHWGLCWGPHATAQNMAGVRVFGAPRAANEVPSCSTLDTALYQDLVDVIPLMESFLISKSLGKSKSEAQPVHRKCGGTKGEIPGWEEGESVVQIVEGQMICELQREIVELKQQVWEKDILLESIAQAFHCQLQETEDLRKQLKEKDSLIEKLVYQNSHHTLQLQTELEDVRQKLYNNDSILEQTVRQSKAEIAAIKAARYRDVMQLETQVEELQQELWEKSRLFQTAELELSDKELELGNMQSLLERVEMNMTKRDSQAGNVEVEVNELHCQVLRLLFQLEIVDTSSSMEAIQSDWFPGQEMEGVIPVMSRAVKEQKEKIDLSRQQYLAATIAARELSSEELLTLVGELRKQLEAFLIRPSLMNAIFVKKQC